MTIDFTYSGTHDASVIQPTYLRNLLADCQTLIDRAKNHSDVEKMKYWFGEKSFTQGRDKKAWVNENVARIHDYLSNSTLELVSKNVNTFAMADQSEPECRIYLGHWFGFQWYNWGDRVVTVFHEVSHKTPGLKTADKQYKGAAAYKGKALALARDASKYGDALMNAENWGYYLTSYYQAAGLAGNTRARARWVSVRNKNAIELRGSPGPNEPKLTPDSAVAWAGKKWIDQQGHVAQAPVTRACIDLNHTNVYEFACTGGNIQNNTLL